MPHAEAPRPRLCLQSPHGLGHVLVSCSAELLPPCECTSKAWPTRWHLWGANRWQHLCPRLVSTAVRKHQGNLEKEGFIGFAVPEGYYHVGGEWQQAWLSVVTSLSNLEPQAGSRENDLEMTQGVKLSKPASSNFLPLVRPHFLNLPQTAPSNVEQLLQFLSLWGLLQASTTWHFL